MLRRGGIFLATTIVSIDLLQVVFLGKGWGAVGGAFLYGLVAFLAHRDRWIGWVLAAVLPVIPLTVVSGFAGRRPYEAFVDRGMLVVLAFQLLLALVAIGVLWRSGVRRGTDLS